MEVKVEGHLIVVDKSFGKKITHLLLSVWNTCSSGGLGLNFSLGGDEIFVFQAMSTYTSCA
jgi:hypothetical protein